MEKIFVKPAFKGNLVRDPVSLQAIPAEGKLVEKTPQWLRYVRCGDVVIVDNPPKTSSKAKK